MMPSSTPEGSDFLPLPQTFCPLLVKRSPIEDASLPFCERSSSINSSERTCETLEKVAMEVFKTRQSSALPSLKKFLAALPNALCIRNVLLSAIKATIEDDPDLGRWVLDHHALWQPELDLPATAQQLALERLQEHGWIFNQDFTFGQDGRLQANATVKADLLATTSLEEHLLITIFV